MPSGSFFMDDLQKLWKNARDNQGRFLEVETDLEAAKELKRVVIETVGGHGTGEKSLKTWKDWVAENLV